MATTGLTVKQRKFVQTYVETGNGTAAALAAYDTDDAPTAATIATENLRKPQLQEAVAELLDAAGLSDRKLAEIHAHYLALHRSPDPREKMLGLRALHMAYQLKGSYAANRHVVFDVNKTIDQMTAVELDQFIATGALPERLTRRGLPPSLASLAGHPSPAVAVDVAEVTVRKVLPTDAARAKPIEQPSLPPPPCESVVPTSEQAARIERRVVRVEVPPWRPMVDTSSSEPADMQPPRGPSPEMRERAERMTKLFDQFDREDLL